MRRIPLLAVAATLSFITAWPASALAQKQPSRAQEARTGKGKPARKRPARKPPEQKNAEPPEASPPDAPEEEPEPATEERAVKKQAADSQVQAEVEKDGDIKTYKFGATEVEGRLKSPQVAYFLRRVRAEFDAGDLGHRSFLRELSHTRQHAAFK